MLDLTMSDTEDSITGDDENKSSVVDHSSEDEKIIPVENVHDSEIGTVVSDEGDIYTDADIFADLDEDSSGGESSLDSMSTCYEELDDEEPVVRIIEQRVGDKEP